MADLVEEAMLLHRRSGYDLREEPWLWLADWFEPVLAIRPVSRLANLLREPVML